MSPRFFALLPMISLVAAVLLWSSSFIALKLAFRAYDPMVVIFGRMLVASLCFVVFAKHFRATTWRMRDMQAIVFMCFCEPCLYFIFEALALKNTTASQAGMITTLMPLMVAMAAGLWLKEKITRRTIAGFLLSISGAVWLSALAVPEAGAPHPALGNFLEFMAMVCATGYVVTLKRLSTHYSPLVLTGMQAFIGTLFYFPVLFLPSTQLPTTLHWTPLAAIVYLGAFITLGAYGLYNYGVSRIPASQAAAFINLIPVGTLIMARLILNERFSTWQYVAAAAVMLGVYVSQDRRPNTPSI